MQGRWRIRRCAPFARRARARPFVALFTGVVLGGLAGLGLLVGHLAGEGVESSALDGSEAIATTLVRTSLEPADVRGGRLQPGALDELSQSALVAGTVDDVRLWRRGAGMVLDMHGHVGGAGARSDALDAAFAGRVASEVAADAAGLPAAAGGRCQRADEIHVFVPLVGDRQRVREVVELCRAAGPVMQTVSERRRVLVLVTLIAAVLLWLVVLPAVVRAARLMAERADRCNRPLVRALHQAMRRDELQLHFQPKVSLRTGEVSGVEALLRWTHPVYGDVPPLAYLPAAERTEAIDDLTLHVLRLATRQAGEWRRRGLELPVAVNVSPAALADPRLAPDLSAMLEEHEVPAQAVTLEITESVLSGDGVLRERVEALAESGVGLSIDDFGTGESSLGRLDQLPLHELKIDRVFVNAVSAGAEPTLLRAVIRLGRDLGLSTVAEGVESAEMVDCLRKLGCDEIQGFYVARPRSAAEIEEWLERRSRAGDTGRDGRFSPDRTSVRSAATT